MNNNEKFIKGIQGLAKFLGCSLAKAQEIKNSGSVPYFQHGRFVLFDPEKVRKALFEKTL